jgi:predicted TIM-barrel fold metal-dependent hydrolase
MYSVDYPYSPMPSGGARQFLEQADMSEADREKIAHGNWQRLTKR